MEFAAVCCETGGGDGSRTRKTRDRTSGEAPEAREGQGREEEAGEIIPAGKVSYFF
jgi:hypothetical protein